MILENTEQDQIWFDSNRYALHNLTHASVIDCHVNQIENTMLTRRVCKIGYCENPQRKTREAHFQCRLKGILSDLCHYDVEVCRYAFLPSVSARTIEQELLKRTCKTQLKMYSRESPISTSVLNYIEFITKGILTEYRTCKYQDIVFMFDDYKSLKDDDVEKFVYVTELSVTSYPCLLKN